MCATSINTFVRTYSDTSNNECVARAAGNYTNTALAKGAKIFLGCISFGVLYGIAALIEHFANVRPKIQEYVRASCTLHAAILNRPPNQKFVEIQTGAGPNLTFTEVDDSVRISDGNPANEKFLKGQSFATILKRIDADRKQFREYYVGLTFSKSAVEYFGDDYPGGYRGDRYLLSSMATQLYSVKLPETRSELIALLRQTFEKIAAGRQPDEDGVYIFQELSHGGLSSAAICRKTVFTYFETYADKLFPS